MKQQLYIYQIQEGWFQVVTMDKDGVVTTLSPELYYDRALYAAYRIILFYLGAYEARVLDYHTGEVL